MDSLEQHEWRVKWSLLGLLVALMLAILTSVSVGPMDISMSDAYRILLSGLGLDAGEVERHLATIINAIRLPRSLLAVLVGAALAVSGAAIQGVFRNPLADPGLIGISGGAALAAVSMIVFGGSALAVVTEVLGQYALMFTAFLGGFAATLVVANIATSRLGISITTMLLAGIAINIVTGAGIGIMTYMADDVQLRTLTFWQMGSLGGATWDVVLAAGSVIAIVIVMIPRYALGLNALLLGESEARHLGIDVRRVRRNIILLSAVAVGASVAVSGMIGFVGLVVPHIIRLALGPDHRYLLPASALAGALFLLIADMIARTLIAPAELPIGLITSIIGGPFFIALIVLRARQGGGI